MTKVAKNPVACTLRLLPGEQCVVLEDDPLIVALWRQKLEQLPATYLVNPEDFSLKRFPLEKSRYIFDHDLAGSSVTGLDLIVEYGLAPRAILVTGHYDDPKILKTAQRLKLKVMAKTEIPGIQVLSD